MVNSPERLGSGLDVEFRIGSSWSFDMEEFIGGSGSDPHTSSSVIKSIRSGLGPGRYTRSIDILWFDFSILRPVSCTPEEFREQRPDTPLGIRHSGRESGIGRLDIIYRLLEGECGEGGYREDCIG